MYSELKSKLEKKDALIAIIGLGYVGLPIAMGLAKKGFKVLGVDIDEKRINALKQGASYIMDVTDQEIEEAMNGHMTVTTTYEKIKEVEAVLICVPTPLTDSKEPDVSFIVRSMDGITKYMTKDTLIVLESTTYPGTTYELITQRIEREKEYKVGVDFFVCYSPERVDPGNKRFCVMNTPKVIGGTTKECLELGKILYESFLTQVVCVSNTKVAEMSKLLENTFRSINIALVNEMTMMCERMGINIWEVIKGASSKPFGFMPFYPGPGIGGHCIPLDPMYLAWEGKKYNYFNRFIELATDINANMPGYVVRQVQDILNINKKAIKGAKVLLLGMAYKKDIDDLRESPALELYELLDSKGAMLNFYDPYVTHFNRGEKVIYGISLTEEVLAGMDLVIIVTDHEIVDYSWIEKHATLIYDTRNVMREITSDKVILLGEQLKK